MKSYVVEKKEKKNMWLPLLFGAKGQTGEDLNYADPEKILIYFQVLPNIIKSSKIYPCRPSPIGFKIPNFFC